MSKEFYPFKYKGTIQANTSKSYAQRALILALLSTSETDIFNVDSSNDVLAIQKCIKQLGAKIIHNPKFLKVVPPIKSKQSELNLNVNESGLALRMLGVVSTLFSESIVLQGEGTLLNRSQEHLIEVLKSLGLIVEHSENKLPIHIKGSISNNSICVDAKDSSQVLSGLLIILPLLPFDTTIELLSFTSRPYIEMTHSILENFGVHIEWNEEHQITIRGNQNYNSKEYYVEGDWSGAANHIVGAAISGEVQIKGLNQFSKQADIRILDAINDFGASYYWKNGELLVRKSKMKPFVFDCTDCPDLFPILAILACGAKGTTLIKGTNRLLNKESNRLEAVTLLLRNFGVNYETKENEILIFGEGKVRPSSIVNSFHDHRIAMAAVIATTLSNSNLIIDEIICINKSYPNFISDLYSLE